MERMIYEVYAKVVDANGAYNTLSGYPKVFDSQHYNNDIGKTYTRALGEFSETFGAMCKREDRQLQLVYLMSAEEGVIDSRVLGRIEDLPDPEPE